MYLLHMFSVISTSYLINPLVFILCFGSVLWQLNGNFNSTCTVAAQHAADEIIMTRTPSTVV